MTRTEFDPGRVWVVKIGSSLLTNAGAGLAVEAVAGWVDDIAWLRAQGVDVRR